MKNIFKKLSGVMRRIIAAGKPKPELPLSDLELVKGLAFLMKHGYYLQQAFKQYLHECAPVKCPETFYGWGYVEGRSEEYRMNKRVSFVLADDDLGFSEYCVLIDGVPSLLIVCGTEKYAPSGLAVQIVSTRDLFDSVFNPGWMPMSTAESFSNLPLPVKTALAPIIRTAAKIASLCELDTQVAMEKLLSLQYGDNK